MRRASAYSSFDLSKGVSAFEEGEKIGKGKEREKVKLKKRRANAPQLLQIRERALMLINRQQTETQCATSLKIRRCRFLIAQDRLLHLSDLLFLTFRIYTLDSGIGKKSFSAFCSVMPLLTLWATKSVAFSALLSLLNCQLSSYHQLPEFC